jgi:hypothetical protein
VYWPEPIAPAPTPLADALALLTRSIEDGARIVAIGPYTNLALLDEAHPGLLARADLYLMGGHLHPIPAGFPRWDATMDFNVQFDVTSARYLLERYSPTLIPIEVTVQTALRRAYLSPRCVPLAPLATSWRARPRPSPLTGRMRRPMAAHVLGCRTTSSISSTTRWPVRSRWGGRA